MTAPPILRVAILGAESTGKSTLAAALAERYATRWVPEYLREFVETRQRVPFEADQAFIAGMQMEREDEAARRAIRILFCDTTPLMTAIYSRFYWHRVDEAVASLAEPHRYDLTVVTAPDTPWEPDGLQRESAQVRAHIHQQVLHTLDVRGIGWHLVEGSVQERVDHVVRLLSDMGACPPAGAVSESGA
ncbi:nicotinamide-nucleotide adenylyltransferase [Massilia arenosa]|uniref:Nicotinamide-nucleotide adenylyltransferase n=1 Tax=Zemynaea arenosa TaxID=2561931 RepID=A0A4Y9SJF5_9BURK|nr:ATP-binding protein [Massilia arenosa]TFW26228.1 nicotinamide-nucleotide adenylyltransferase [Massilia arenosa]